LPRHVNASFYVFACLTYRYLKNQASSLKIKGKDCGTINGHNESSSIRPLMKDAREVLVR
ncbi:hypothetical protein, partial [Escherichia coli]|uniref:hypothetical protein n=1 Tax=Escherichia coli TaxID=562 RepID=UPI001BDCBF9E